MYSVQYMEYSTRYSVKYLIYCAMYSVQYNEYIALSTVPCIVYLPLVTKLLFLKVSLTGSQNTALKERLKYRTHTT